MVRRPVGSGRTHPPPERGRRPQPRRLPCSIWSTRPGSLPHNDVGTQRWYQLVSRCLVRGREAVMMASPSSAGVTLTEISLVRGTRHSFTVANSMSGAYANPLGKADLVVIGLAYPLQLAQLSLTGKLETSYPRTFSGAGRFNGAFAFFTQRRRDCHGRGRRSGRARVEPGRGAAKRCHSGHHFVHALPLVERNPGTGVVPAGRKRTPASLAGVGRREGTDSTFLTTAGPRGRTRATSRLGRLPAACTQDTGGCGYQYLAKRNAVGQHHPPVYVPLENSQDSVTVLASATGRQLLVQASLACGPWRALLWFHPAEGSVNLIIVPGMNGGSVEQALLFGTEN